ncbi:hypothetical protein QR680_007439 [Steinernema hermaphroditum]|uniref:ATP-grasp domain-containing protein n=1 Tax=Steinernema hermaphroditum TaxID=289476 RepID=A0AA39IEL9_9BILA|nr:hypothetical protein QR680_007439 [Steinernema hermaphroditum]
MSVAVKPLLLELPPAIPPDAVSQSSTSSTDLSDYRILTQCDKDALLSLAKSKKEIVVVMKRQGAFFGFLFDLAESRPNDKALVAFVPKRFRQNVSPQSEGCFDWIIYYDDSFDNSGNPHDLDDIHLTSFHTFGRELVEIVPRKMINLVHTEEISMSEVCRMREEHGLKGAYLADVEHLRRKELLYQTAEQANIPHAKTLFIDFAVESNKKRLITHVMDKIGDFPMFVKPALSCGTFGCSKISSMDDLNQWITQEMADSNPKKYVIQEYLDGREVSISIVLLQNGTFKPLVVKHMGSSYNYICMATGEPVISIVEHFERAGKRFPGIYEFAKKVVDTFKPMPPQMFTVQGFQIMDGNTPKYYFNEVAYRPAGEVVTGTMYSACGIDQYASLMLASLDPNYEPHPNAQWTPKLQTSFSFTLRKGTLASHNDLPKSPMVKGTVVQSKWYVSPGQKMQMATYVDDYMLSFVLESANEAERDTDVKWIRENWRPDVAEE